jgi:PAS domain-containing protein
MLSGFAYHKIITDKQGHPEDYVFLEVNDAFESLTGLKKENIVGKKLTEAIPEIKDEAVDWIERYGQVALTGKEIKFEQYSEALNRWYSVSAYSPRKGYFHRAQATRGAAATVAEDGSCGPHGRRHGPPLQQLSDRYHGQCWPGSG